MVETEWQDYAKHFVFVEYQENFLSISKFIKKYISITLYFVEANTPFFISSYACLLSCKNFGTIH